MTGLGKYSAAILVLINKIAGLSLAIGQTTAKGAVSWKWEEETDWTVEGSSPIPRLSAIIEERIGESIETNVQFAAIDLCATFSPGAAVIAA